MSHLPTSPRPDTATATESLWGRLRRHHDSLAEVKRTLHGLDAALSSARRAQQVQAARNRMVLSALDSGDLEVLETVRARLYGERFA